MDNKTKNILKEVIDDMSCEEMRELLLSNVKNGDDKFVGYDYEGSSVENHEVTISVVLTYMK